MIATRLGQLPPEMAPSASYGPLVGGSRGLWCSLYVARPGEAGNLGQVKPVPGELWFSPEGSGGICDDAPGQQGQWHQHLTWLSWVLLRPGVFQGSCGLKDRTRTKKALREQRYGLQEH